MCAGGGGAHDVKKIDVNSWGIGADGVRLRSTRASASGAMSRTSRNRVPTGIYGAETRTAPCEAVLWTPEASGLSLPSADQLRLAARRRRLMNSAQPSRPAPKIASAPGSEAEVTWPSELNDRLPEQLLFMPLVADVYGLEQK